MGLISRFRGKKHVKLVEEGNKYLKQDLHEEALNCYEEALKINPENPNVYYNIGLVYLGEEKYDDALKVYDELVKEYPDFMEAWRIKSFIYRDTENFRKLLNHTTKFCNWILII